MAKKSSKKLRPGKGAEATILTKFIKPKQPYPNDKHRSNIILLKRYFEEKGSKLYHFQYANGKDANGNVTTEEIYANARYVKVTKEGEPEEFFDEEEWKDSNARKLLFQDLVDGTVPLVHDPTFDTKDIYSYRPEYSATDWNKFGGRLSSLRDIVKASKKRADVDKKAFENFVSNHPVSTHSAKGYIQWQGSTAQVLAKADIAVTPLEPKGAYRTLYSSRPEYQQFPFKAFSDKIRQEIQTAKYIHTLKVKGFSSGRNKKKNSNAEEDEEGEI